MLQKAIHRYARWPMLVSVVLLFLSGSLLAQGVTTGAISGIVADSKGQALLGANVVAVHEPSGTRYGAASRAGGAFNIPNMKIGGPYTVTVSYVGYKTQQETEVYVNLGQTVRLDFKLPEEAIAIGEIEVTAEQDVVLNSGRTGAATYIRPEAVVNLPSIKRSTRDLTRVDPRSDGNFSFGGRNWLYNNISLDGSYFNNPFGLDDPAPGGQASAEPVPYDAVEQVQVSVAPFDVRQGGFTGAGINTVTKSGTNQLKGSVYSFIRNESLLGNKVRGTEVIANPDLKFNQSGFTISGPLAQNKLFFFLNGELERRDDPATNFVANRDGTVSFGESRVSATVMDQIRARLGTYGYETGPYDGFIHETNNEKVLLKLDWNINDRNNLTFRYNRLNASRDLPPHPFVLSFNNTGRGPNENSLPFQNSGYQINNKLNSFALEINSRYNKFANRFFASFNRFRDFREPFSAPFPTIEIGENGVQYTTAGHEPFSIHNILDQDIWQFTNNFSLFSGKHVYTFGATFESFSFFNSFNIFRHGVFFLPAPPASIGTTFSSLNEFLTATDPNNPNRINFNSYVGTGPFKGENISVGQLAFYAQDEFLVSPKFNLTYGLRADLPMYFTDLVDNPFSRSLRALDENGNSETVDQSKLPDTKFLFSPRVGFNWDAKGDRSTQLRGGTGIFTGRVPFVWIGNNISNPGANPNLYDPFANPNVSQIPTKKGSILRQSFDLNAMDPEFKWPQVWTSDLAIDQKLPWDMLGTLEFLYGKDINSVFVRNADLVTPVRTLPDGRPYYGGFGNNELNSDGGAGIYVIDNTSEGHSLNITAQLRKNFGSGLNTGLSYSFTEAKNNLKSTEIASVLWQNQPVQGNPNKPELSFSEFGNRHRIVGNATYTKQWSSSLATHFGLFLEVADGNRFAGAGGNRYSFIYSGDVNGDGTGGNDLIYIPRSQNEIIFDSNPAQQWAALDAFIQQDKYLNSHRGQIAERFGAVNPWFSNVDLRILQDFSLNTGSQKHTFQLNFDILNLANLINSELGVRKVASVAATSPLQLVRFDATGAPVFNFIGPKETYIDDPSLLSRWQIQLGLRYFFE
ncbi:carboxypeptidase regulatory-like domain-containing protein [candidate division KSB1 bacterium]|nr:carboxypeptidase regulatory-like domain-containing protein [candidate division KSB1 bacterium]